MASEGWFGIGAGVAMVVGAIGPWVDAGLITVGGLDGDGVIVLICGAIVSVAAAFAGQAKTAGAAAVVVLLAALAASATAIYDIANVYSSETEIFGQTIRVGTPGWGLWLSAVASVAAAVAGIALFRVGRKP